MRDVYLRLYPNLPQLGGLMKVTSVRTLPDRYAVGFAPDMQNTAVRITLINELQSDQDLDLEVEFEVLAPKKSGYVLFGESEGILSLPYAYPMLARQTGDPAHPWRLEIPPTFADIAITNLAFYSVTATLPADYTIVTAGVEITQTQSAASQWIDHYMVTGPAREWTMLVSKNLHKLSQSVDGNQINNYYLTKDANTGKSAMAYSAAVMRVYDRLFSPYVFTQLDVTEAPTRYLGMEYPKLNYIGQDVYRDVANSQEILIAHEISHQWWYALVGSDPYKYPWLDEGLAEHSSLLYMETIYGEEVADRIRSHRWRIPVKWVQDHGYDAPVGQEVTAFNGTNYEILVYAKSALFFDGLYQKMGRERYLEVLQTFIDRYRFKTPKPEDFLDTVREVGGIDPMPLYKKWIESTGSISGD
jgi:aminopeptidase N